MPYFTTPDGCDLYYTTDNFKISRPPVVFLNGTSHTTIYWEPHAAAFAKHFRAITDYLPLDNFLKTIQCPTLVISGSDDLIVRADDARQLAKDCHGHHEIFTEIGHSIPAEAPELFQQMVLGFLKQR